MGAISSAIMIQLFETCGNLAVAKDQHEFLAAVPENDDSGGSACSSARGMVLMLDDTSLASRQEARVAREPKEEATLGRGRQHVEALVARREALILELFSLHDLNKNGVLEEEELIKLNEKIAMLHHGKDTDKGAVRTKYRELFRTNLDPEGQPVPFETFRSYMLDTLRILDRDPRAQDLIMDQFIAEAQSGRMCFHCKSFESITDAPFRPPLEAGPHPHVTLASVAA